MNTQPENVINGNESDVIDAEVMEQDVTQIAEQPIEAETEEGVLETQAEAPVNGKINGNGEKPYKSSKNDYFNPHFSRLRIMPQFNFRTDYGNIEELAASIKENGVINPIKGYRTKDETGEIFVVTQGHRRHAACKLIFERDNIDICVPFVVEKAGVPMEQRILETFSANEGKDLTPLEQAEGVRRLLAYKWTVPNIAKRLGKKETAIRNLEKLSNIPQALKDLVATGAITPAIAISAADDGNVEDLLSLYADKLNEAQNALDNGFNPETTLALSTGEGKTPVDISYKGKGKPEKEAKEVKISRKELDEKAGKVNSYRELKAFMAAADTENFNECQTELYTFLDRLINNDMNVKKIGLHLKKFADYKKQPKK